MTTKTLVRLLIALAVLAILALVAFTLNRSKTGGSGTASTSSDNKVFADLDVNQIAGLKIKAGDDTTEMVRKEGEWIVANREGFPANYDEVREFVMGLRDLKRVGQPLGVPEDQLKRFGLNEDAEKAPVHIELLKEDGSALQSFVLGGSRKGNGSDEGRYVKVGDSSQVQLVSEKFFGLKASAGEWLNKDFFKVEKIASVSLSDPNPEESWKVSREDAGGEFSLVDGKPEESADPAKTSSFKWMLGSPSFEDVLPAEEAKKINFGIGSHSAEITTFDGFKYLLAIAKKEKAAEEEGDQAEAEYFLKVDVSADLAAAMPNAEEGQTEEQATAAKEAWEAEHEKLKLKLANEMKLKGRVFRIAEYTVSSLMKTKSDILVAEPEAGPPAGGTGGAPPAGLGGPPAGGPPNGGRIPSLPPGLTPPGPPPGGGAPPAIPPPTGVTPVEPPMVKKPNPVPPEKGVRDQLKREAEEKAKTEAAEKAMPEKAPTPAEKPKMQDKPSKPAETKPAEKVKPTNPTPTPKTEKPTNEKPKNPKPAKPSAEPKEKEKATQTESELLKALEDLESAVENSKKAE